MLSKNSFQILFKSLRFRLTLIYSLILFIYCAIFVLGFNIYLNQYLHKDPTKIPKPTSLQIKIENSETTTIINNVKDPNLISQFQELSEAERERIRNIREEDLRNVQTLSVVALFPLAIFSFFIGYFVSGNFLEPLNKLKREFDSPDIKNLGKQIVVEEDDEIGALITSYNEMSLRLKRSFDSQTQFVQDASHELRTPLTVMRTNIDTVLDDKDATKAELEQSMMKVLLSIENMKSLSDNLFELTLTQQLKFEKIELNEFLIMQLDLIKSFAKDKGVEILYIKSKEEKVFFDLDKTSFSRAITNLLDNAIKYSKEVDKPKVKLLLEQNIIKGKQKIKISVIDNGIGIPMELQGKIFERFFRVDKSRNRKTGGFGLGLSIVKHIVEENGGRISVVSEPGNTKFTISL